MELRRRDPTDLDETEVVAATILYNIAQGNHVTIQLSESRARRLAAQSVALANRIRYRFSTLPGDGTISVVSHVHLPLHRPGR